MHQIAMYIAQKLDFNVARVAHQFFQIHFIVAKRCECLTTRDLKLPGQLGFGFNDAHTAPTPTPAGFEHQRIAD